MEKLVLARHTRDARIRGGADPVIAGWQCFLEEMLIRMEPYLQPAHLVTFQSMTPDEQSLYRELADTILLPSAACAVFIPPSVLHGMMMPETVSGQTDAVLNIPRMPTESGIVLASACRDYRLIVNGLLAHPPYSPGIDVYEEGRLLAGYAYASLAECRQNLPDLIQTYL